MEVATPPNTIVPEVLKENNYERWSIFMEHYLVAQDLWDVIQSEQMPEDGNLREWTIKNALALHAIKISCGSKAFDRIKKIQSAKCAWDVLGVLVNVRTSPVVNLDIEELHEVVNPDIFELSDESQTGSHTPEVREYNWMVDSIYHGCFIRVKRFLRNNSSARSARLLENGYTALHLAISAGQQWIAEELIAMTGEQELENQDNSGNTALSLAARNGMMRIAKCLIGKNERLLTKPDTNGQIPVMLACRAGHEDMTRYLYRETPLEVLEGDNSFYLLQECITKKMFDVAFDLVHNFQDLAFRSAPSDSIPIILTLAKTPPPFFRGTQLGFWGRLIYKFIRVKVEFIKPSSDQQSCAQKILHFYQSCAAVLDQNCGKLLLGLIFFPFILLGGVLFITFLAIVLSPFWIGLYVLAFVFVIWIKVISASCTVSEKQSIIVAMELSSFFLNPECNSFIAAMAIRGLISLPSLILGTLVSVLTRVLATHIYNLKLKDDYAREFIRRTCHSQLSKLDPNQFVQSGAVEATFQAIKNGIPDIVIEIIQANPNISWSCTNPEDSRNMFASAVSYRQEKLVRHLYEFGGCEDISNVSSMDGDENNTLHLAAKLAPHSQLSCISGAALQLQSELRWFKAVEGVVPRFYSEQKNKDGKTPFQIFVEDHKNLLKEAEAWIKKTAESSTVVGTLIITIMFAAVFTAPGGNDQITGFPIFLAKKPASFKVFIVSDAISLFSASSAVLMFLGILTSRFAYEDFLKSIPRKLIIGLSSLFISIATMMATFCAALFIMLQGQLWIVVPITLLAGVPVTLFVLLQSPLFIEIYVSTFSSDIFSRRRIKKLSKMSKIRFTLANSHSSIFTLKSLPGLMLHALWRLYCVCE